MEDREGNGVGFEIEFGLTGRRRRPFFGEADVRLAKRQRKSRKPPEYVAFPGRDKAKRQRKKGNLAKAAAFRAGKKPKKAAKIEETAGICCFSRARQGEKAAKKGKPSESRCL